MKNKNKMSELPNISDLTLKDFQAMDPDSQGRIIARELKRIEANGRKINSISANLIKHQNYNTLALDFGTYLKMVELKGSTNLVEPYLDGFEPGDQIAFTENARDLIGAIRN